MSLFARRALRLGVASLPVFLLAAVAAEAAPSEATSCNVFFPLGPQTRWTYRESAPGVAPTMERTLTVVSVSTSADGVSAELAQEVRLPGKDATAAGRATTTVRCDKGTVTLLVKGSAEVGSSTQGTVTARLAGLPPANLLVPGYQWRSESEIDSSEGASRAVTRGVRDNKVESTETVVVPAGTFRDAIKILAIETLTTQTDKGTHTARQERVEWFGSGVGLVKRETRIRRGQDVAISTEILERFAPGGSPKAN